MPTAGTTAGTGDLDVFIAGGGYVGLSLAVALKKAAPGLAVAVADARPPAAFDKDERASAFAAAACRLFDTLGVWRDIRDEAQPITDMIVTDSRLRDMVRPVYLTFEGDLAPGEPFAHMLHNRILVKALLGAAEKAGVELLAPAPVDDFSTGDEHVTIRLKDGSERTARLLVAADGVRSRLRDLANIRTVKWDYGQSGIVTTVAHERPHHGRAEEHFLPSGPFAILPLKGDRSSLVWTEKRGEAERLVAGDDFTFELELERRFGRHLGKLRLDGPRQAYPLGLTLAHSFIAPRLALAGDAAHGIHPISGQGLNLGFRDIAALAEIVVETHRLGLDVGSMEVLERYQSWRRFDTWQMGVVTDVLNRLFSNDNDLIRAVRDFGLGVVDRLPGLKKAFIGEAAGMAGNVPRLLRGEAL
ncbi:2-octaprenyl-6-methoxyphenol hydroxylase [Rhodobium orientis]|uniref:2-octaprenyl-6-methoxyphenyl hydroxylase n=1 Tax=Rhodobium orientis TaxID=34017 RepID=A0A327JQW1_9HYPH|nr:ubiquinone biosynthesis hydroxylase [Rhodobium orientis]MBB4304350.1 2-octaprenyl-6-methoxyphenol hydroxylase [Rhodobium orientis]MBK5948156.1 2-octaprenyl-6-methoxyphenyl hydroxylase [Rhodobium orientis]RAI28869.1 2-octaprenyl-6-methoxyphenyl hydroxylase [Rhodobium orientis]